MFGFKAQVTYIRARCSFAESEYRLSSQAFWYPDVSLLIGLFIIFTAASYVALVLLVKEKR